MKQRRKTAAELMAELQADPTFRQWELEKERELQALEQQHARLIEPVLNRLREHSLRGNSIEEIVRNHAPLSADAIEVLLAALPKLNDDRAKESVVRALGAAGQSFDGRSLVDCFAQTQDERLKWAVVNTIALTNPHSIDDWLAKITDTSWEETLQTLRGQGRSKKKR